MTTDKRKKLLQSLPAVGESIHAPELAAVVDAFPRSLVVRALRDEIEHLRALILAGKVATVDAVSFYRAVQERIRRHDRPRLTRLINATGIVVHTNLGRSPLAEPAVAAVMQAARGYSNLEYDLTAGRRGSRTTLVEDILCELTGAEAALVVNNNAGAVLLALSSLAKDREAVVSRGELIEIGGSFRIPDVMAASGAMMVEVGTTNRTHLADYEKAINERTSLLLKVHTSNYRIQGFTKTVTGAELAELAHANGVKAIEDLGSGCLTDTALLHLPYEPTAAEVVAGRLDVVTFSGDKLLGGPQAGVLVGKVEAIRACAKNPLHRALRVDKMTLAALEATLRLYRDPQLALATIPTLRMVSTPKDVLTKRAEQLAADLRRDAGELADFEIVVTEGQVGGGAMPLAQLDDPAVAVHPKSTTADTLVAALRARELPIIVRIEHDAVLADPRTILDDELPLFHNGLVEELRQLSEEKENES